MSRQYFLINTFAKIELMKKSFLGTVIACETRRNDQKAIIQWTLSREKVKKPPAKINHIQEVKVLIFKVQLAD